MHAASTEARLDTEHGVAVLTYDRLDAQAITASVADDTAGATAVFIGTTRNSFRGTDIDILHRPCMPLVRLSSTCTTLTTPLQARQSPGSTIRPTAV